MIAPDLLPAETRLLVALAGQLDSEDREHRADVALGFASELVRLGLSIGGLVAGHVAMCRAIGGPLGQLDDRGDLLARLLIAWASDDGGDPMPMRRGKVSADLAIALRDEIEGGGHPRCAARVVGLLASCIGTISEMAVEDTLALGVTAYRAQAGEQ